MRKFIICLLLIAAGVGAESAEQTDWSGGPGVTGPVTDWGDAFYTSSDVDWSSRAGSLLLEAVLLDAPEKNTITGEITYAFRTCCADLDQDGDVDVLLITDYTETDSDEVSWWENLDGAGTSWEQHVLTSTFPDAQDINCGDIDGDDDLDILTTGWESSYLSWWENVDLGTGDWVEHVIDLDGDPVVNPIGADLVYLDTDGDLDIVLSDLAHGNSNVMFIENDDYGEDWLKNTIDGWYNSPWYPRAGDLDDDGYPDLAACSIGYDDVYWWRNEDGYGTFGSAQIISDGELDDPKQIELADLDDDDDLDVIVCSPEDGVFWWANDGSGGGWAMTTISEVYGSRSLEALDVDADEDIDLLFSTEGGVILWFENADGVGGSWNEHTVDDFVPNCRWAEGADINDDGHPDVVSACKTEDSLYWWQLTGFQSGALTSSILDTGFETAFSYGLLIWESELPADCGLAFRVRSGDDHTDLGDWSDPISTSGTDLSGYLAQAGRYFQYRLEALSVDPNQTPRLDSLEITYGADEVPPQIDHQQITSADLDSALAVEAEISDNNEIALARVFYRRGGDVEFSYTDLKPDSGDTYSASIPEAFVTERGLDYYLWASDGINTVTLPADGPDEPFNVAVEYAGEGIDPGAPQHAGNTVADYRLFSVPTDYGADGGSPADVLEDDLGAYDDEQWRLARYQAGGFVEYTQGSIEYFKPGRAYWLIVAAQGILLDSGAGSSPDCSEPYGVALEPGWNQLACPFCFSVGWQEVLDCAANSAIAADLEPPVAYDGDFVYEQAALTPWTGYWVNYNGPAATTLYVPPVEYQPEDTGNAGPPFLRPLAETAAPARLLGSLPQPWVSRAPETTDRPRSTISGTVGSSTPAAPTVGSPGDRTSGSRPTDVTTTPVASFVDSGAEPWLLELRLDSGGLVDGWNRLGVVVGAERYWDEHERHEPPHLAGAPRLSFVHEDWPSRRGVYATDLRAAVGEGAEFVLEVTPAAGADEALFSWRSLEDPPPSLEAALYDPAVGCWLELDGAGDYRLELLPREDARTLRIYVGPCGWLDEQRPEAPRRAYLLQSYPNPAADELTIRFGLDEAGPVELAVYDLAGRRVVTLLDETLPAGERAVRWDGCDNAGRAVADGVYLYLLRSGAEALTRRLVISR